MLPSLELRFPLKQQGLFCSSLAFRPGVFWWIGCGFERLKDSLCLWRCTFPSSFDSHYLIFVAGLKKNDSPPWVFEYVHTALLFYSVHFLIVSFAYYNYEVGGEIFTKSKGWAFSGDWNFEKIESWKPRQVLEDAERFFPLTLVLQFSFAIFN